MYTDVPNDGFNTGAAIICEELNLLNVLYATTYQSEVYTILTTVCVLTGKDVNKS